MDGDVAPLAELLALADAHDAWLVVDDAHGFGVLGEGRGSVAHVGLASERIVYMGTLGKAAGVAGAFVAAHPAVIELLVQTARPYIYTTAAPPLLACALSASLALIRDDGARRARLHARIAQFTRRRRRAAVRVAALADADPAAGRRRERRPRSRWPRHCGNAGFGCRRSGRRRSPKARRGCASRCPPRTPTTTSHACWPHCGSCDERSCRGVRRRPAAGAAARLGNACRAVRAAIAGAGDAPSRARGRPARARPQRRAGPVHARRRRRRRRCGARLRDRAADGARLVARRRRRATLGDAAARAHRAARAGLRRHRASSTATTGRTAMARRRLRQFARRTARRVPRTRCSDS